jgi:hypothetical protein
VLPDGRSPSFADTRELKYIMRCINESMRLYPHPPVRKQMLCVAPHVIRPVVFYMMRIARVLSHKQPALAICIGVELNLVRVARGVLRG